MNFSEKTNGEGKNWFGAVNDEARDEISCSFTYSICGYLIWGGILALKNVLSLYSTWFTMLSPLHIEARFWNISLADFPSRMP